MLVHYHRGEERARALAAELGGAPVAQADLTREATSSGCSPRRASTSARSTYAPPSPACTRRGRPGLGARARALRAHDRENLTATFLTARAFLREVAATGRGALVLVGSTAGRFGEAGHADYAAAKAAIQVGLLLSLKNEAARLGPACA